MHVISKLTPINTTKLPRKAGKVSKTLFGIWSLGFGYQLSIYHYKGDLRPLSSPWGGAAFCAPPHFGEFHNGRWKTNTHTWSRPFFNYPNKKPWLSKSHNVRWKTNTYTWRGFFNYPSKRPWLSRHNRGWLFEACKTNHKGLESDGNTGRVRLTKPGTNWLQNQAFWQLRLVIST